MPEPLRRRRESVTLPGLSGDAGEPVVWTIERIPPSKMFEIMERLPGEVPGMQAQLDQLSEAATTGGLPEQIRLLKDFTERCRELVEAGVVGPHQVRFADPPEEGFADGHALSVGDLTLLGALIFRLSG